MAEHLEKYEIESAQEIFPNLKCLILINTNLSWKTLFNISAAFEHSIEELLLCKNDLIDVANIDEEKVNRMKHLTFLNLE